MDLYPVKVEFDGEPPRDRVQLLIRVAVLTAIGFVGMSLGLVIVLGYLSLPIIAAILASQKGGRRYLDENSDGIEKILVWAAAIFAWLGLVTDTLPTQKPEQTARLHVVHGPEPTSSSALVRLITGLPSGIVLALLSFFGSIVWIIGFVFILVKEELPDSFRRLFAGLVRWTIRLMAYQASLVEEYPPFALDHTPQERTAA